MAHVVRSFSNPAVISDGRILFVVRWCFGKAEGGGRPRNDHIHEEQYDGDHDQLNGETINCLFI